jgi:hypothetical protein
MPWKRTPRARDDRPTQGLSTKCYLEEAPGTGRSRPAVTNTHPMQYASLLDVRRDVCHSCDEPPTRAFAAKTVGGPASPDEDPPPRLGP